MLKFFQVTFFLLTLISLGPQGYASDDDLPPFGGGAAAAVDAEDGAADQDAAAPAPILIQQIEEGWRWRQNLDVNVVHGDQACLVQGKDIHTQMSAWEADIRSSLRGSRAATSNLAVAAISVVYQGLNGMLQRKTAWIQDITCIQATDEAAAGVAEQAPISGRRPYGFISDSAARLSPQFARAVLAVHPRPEAMRCHLICLWAPVMHDFFPNLLEILISPSADRGFPQDWHHSEQKLIHFLWDCAEGKTYHQSPIHQTIEALLPDEVQGDISCLRAVILHVHSQRDPCQRCAAALRTFASKAQAGLRALQEGTLNCRFLVTVSGGESHQDSRIIRGHDGGLAASPITLDVSPGLIEAQHAEDAVYVNFHTAIADPAPAHDDAYALLPLGL